MGFILEDVLNSLERVSDHCSNIALEMLTIFEDEYNTHGYFRDLEGDDRRHFDEDYRALVKKYSL